MQRGVVQAWLTLSAAGKVFVQEVPGHAVPNFYLCWCVRAVVELLCI